MAGKYACPDFNDFYKRYLEVKNEINHLPKNIIKKEFSHGDNKYENYYTLSKVLISNEHCLFRKSDKSSDALVHYWLSKAAQKAALIANGSRLMPFEMFDLDYISSLIKRSVDPNSIIDLPRELISKGIILIYEPSLEGMKLDGVVYKNSTGNPVIALSFRYSRVDSFWFTLAHELAHIYLHYEELDNAIYEDLDCVDNNNLIELQANKLAKELLVDKKMWRGSQVRRLPTEEGIKKFAKELGIHPAIIAGKIRFESGDYRLFSKLVHSVNLREIIFRDE
ncbi:ImmA/IrrE family metallo-endopeptidase [Aeromonas enteropelogenes]|uniref:ImmA/IrrE family metallo-endopeptidase n=1 Tax=Aeromonas enteropelogenes TaxID=29489 RepID=UPI003BA3942A